MPRILKLIISIALPLVVGGLAGYATSSNIEGWYANLNKPSFNPPSYVFGPVWTLLYILMGISLYIVWSKGIVEQRLKALLIFAGQLCLNFAWSFIFFYFHQPGWALLEIIVLWIFILLMIRAFKPIDKLAAYLQIPYLLWVSFATILNGAIFYLNL
jgi:tryptophan-rich sensory protein